MKDTHLTLRLPRELARALARWARERGVPKSQVAREAVVRYLAPAPPERTPPVTAAEVAARWPTLPHLTPAEAAAFAADLETARRELPPDRDPWA
jgi:hypothetical protein